MKTLVVGFGSIGRRHFDILDEMGCPVAVVSRRCGLIGHPNCYDSLEDALKLWCPGYVVIANETSAHYTALQTLAASGFTGRVLVEKPIFDIMRSLPSASFSNAAVAYNLRQHPAVRALRHELQGKNIVEASFHVGQWLPSWRENTDGYRSYSGSREKGGGALRDLSHELDLALHFFGPWKRMTAAGGHFSALDIDSDDTYTLLLEATRCPLARVSMNYMDKPARRHIAINTNDCSFSLDLIRGVLEKDGERIGEYFVDRNHTYRAQHQAMIDGHFETLCSMAEGLEVLNLIVAAETANSSRSWIERA